MKMICGFCEEQEVVTPLCRDIETDLRLHVHSAHLKGTVNINPTKTGVRDLSWFLQVQPLRLASKYIHIKSHVENYLNAAFYNHAAVSPHNWKVRGEVVMGWWELALD
jgi:WASH complex subunit 7